VETRVELELSPVRGDDPARRERGAGSEALGAGGPAPAVRAALATAAGQAARGLRLGLSADGKPVAALVADLESPDIRVREHAVQALGERGDRSAVPALLKRLRDGDPGVVHRTVGALAQLRDPRAVPELIELSRGGDAAVTVRLVRIVGDIGGDDARGWLLTLEQAHADPRVRAAAAEALADAARVAAPAR
jgi:HEAT repeat protein